MILKADPVEMRKALQVVDTLKKIGILFIPMPVLSSEDGLDLAIQLKDRLQKLEEMIETNYDTN